MIINLPVHFDLPVGTCFPFHQSRLNLDNVLFSFAALDLWNRLPLDLKLSLHLTIFKRQLETSLYTQSTILVSFDPAPWDSIFFDNVHIIGFIMKFSSGNSTSQTNSESLFCIFWFIYWPWYLFVSISAVASSYIRCTSFAPISSLRTWTNFCFYHRLKSHKLVYATFGGGAFVIVSQPTRFKWKWLWAVCIVAKWSIA